jgi:hypothetical protein
MERACDGGKGVGEFEGAEGFELGAAAFQDGGERGEAGVGEAGAVEVRDGAEGGGGCRGGGLGGEGCGGGEALEKAAARERHGNHWTRWGEGCQLQDAACERLAGVTSCSSCGGSAA